MKLYIDFSKTIPPRDIQKFHGGGNYTRSLINQLIENKNELGCEIVILYPDYYVVNKKSEPLLADNKFVSWKMTSNLSQEEFEPGDILFCPILYDINDFKTYYKIKKKYHFLKVCATVHDVRMFDFVYDETEKYFLTGFKRVIFGIYKIIVEFLYPRFQKRYISRCLGALDRIYTVSNFSMQEILKINRHTNVSWYYQGSIFEDDFSSDNEKREDYILFTSGARRIKNLNHALVGFSKYKKAHSDSQLKLIITGIDEKKMKSLSKIKGVDSKVFKESVIYKEYVSYEELKDLYRYCKFVLYLSKSEGFGLPVLEAAMYRKTSLCSNRTSIPEVLGASVCYVNPMDDEGIADALYSMYDQGQYIKYQKRVESIIPMIKNRISLDQKFFLNDLVKM